MSRVSGRPVLLSGGSLPTYTIEDLRHDEDASSRSVSSGTATVDSASTTTSAASGPDQANPNIITVSSSTGINAGHDYLISNASGEQEIVRVAEIGVSAATVLTLAGPLRHTYSSGAPFVGIEQAISFDATIAGTESRLHDGAGPFWVEWSYTADGEPHVVGHQVWLTRYNVVPPISEADVAMGDPSTVRKVTTDGRYSLSSAIMWATDEVVGDLGAHRVDKDYYYSPEFSRAVYWKTIWALNYWAGDESNREIAEREYDRKLRSMTHTLPPVGSVQIEPEQNVAPAGDSKKRRGFFARL